MTVTSPQGFRAAGVAAGIKNSGRPDVAVVINDGPCSAAAGVFTSNRVKAAPVLWSQQTIAGGEVRAVVLNSGGANACTGPAGYADTRQTAEHLASLLSVAGQIAVCSTGLIGERLPMHQLLVGVDAATGLGVHDRRRGGGKRDHDHGHGRQDVRRAGQRLPDRRDGQGRRDACARARHHARGADHRRRPAAGELDKALRGAVRTTFDRLDSDGCMSTNDTVLLLASGASGVKPDLAEFSQLLTSACEDLARQLLRDCEGATKAIAVDVVGADSEDDALAVGRAIARCNLFKCAITGEDPNWGRVLAAVGTTGAVFEPDELNVAINGIWVCENGAPGEDRSAVDLSARNVTVTVDLSAGNARATVLTTDLSAAYVHENSAYST